MLRTGLILFALLLQCSLALADEESASKEFLDFQQRVATMLTVRSNAYQFAQSTGITQSAKPVLTRAQSNQLRDLAGQYLAARNALLPEAEKISPLFNSGTLLTLTSDKPTGKLVSTSMPDSGDAMPLSEYAINPLDAKGRVELQRILRGLAAAMVLWDSYRIAVEPYEKNSSMRYALNYDVGNAASLRDLAKNYYSPELRTRLLKAMRFVDDYAEWQRTQQFTTTAEEDYLYALTQSTLWYAELHASGTVQTEALLHFASEDIQLHTQRVQRVLSYGLSMGFGNMVGLVQTRRGKLAKMSSADMAKLSEELKPLDILLEKTPFRLTDKMIPGHYGHVAVWLGSEEELRALGVWEQIIPAYQDKIRKGGRIVEALRGGVTISTLEHFLNIDDLLALRDQRPVSPEYKRQAILTALAQVGKEYDFNFDVYTHQRIVCSELAYVVFPDVAWPLERTLGRYTISPDNVAQLAVIAQPVFDPAVIYRDGQRVQADLRPILAKLIDRKNKPADTAPQDLAVLESQQPKK